jgi:DNA-binding CsgD family transcriptional regulator
MQIAACHRVYNHQEPVMNELMYAVRPSAAPAPYPALLPGGGAGATGALARMLDMVDFGMLLVVDATHVAYANQVARAELDETHPLRLDGGALTVRDAREAQPLRIAIDAARQRGVQSMLRIGVATASATPVAIVPLRETSETPMVLLLFGRRRVCEDLSADAYARVHALTLAETRVLKLLCAGRRPGEIARSLGVKLTTVRTQIGAIRAKTGARDVGTILHQLSRLPPMPSWMRRAA